jgi:hypothetical protein
LGGTVCLHQQIAKAVDELDQLTMLLVHRLQTGDKSHPIEMQPLIYLVKKGRYKICVSTFAGAGKEP